jgi:hypothetical protein
LKDGRNENGLGPDQILVNQGRFGEMFLLQSLIYAFGANADNKTNQDIGLNGLSNTNEGEFTIILQLNRIQRRRLYV